MYQALNTRIAKARVLRNTNILYLLFKDKDFYDTIIQLNTETQLYSQGVDGEGKSLGEYSWYTTAIKKEKGQRTDHVTLKDTGAFYASFRLYWANNAIRFTADTIKDDGSDLIERWGRDILGLNEDSLSQLRYIARDKIIAILKKILL